VVALVALAAARPVDVEAVGARPVVGGEYATAPTAVIAAPPASTAAPTPAVATPPPAPAPAAGARLAALVALAPEREVDVRAVRAWTGPVARGLHSSTFQLNLSAFCGIGGAFRGCL